jgi:branched-chain amino acid transport system substrate-binding protein
VKNNPAVEALLVWGANGPAAAIATRQVRELGLPLPLLLTVAQADPAYVQDAGAAANGTILEANRPLIASYVLPDDPAHQPVAHFVTAYTQAAGKEPNQFAALGYDAFSLLAQAMSAAGTDPDHLVAELEKTTFTGVAGPYAFSASTHAGMQPSALAMVTIRSGAFVPVKPNCDGCAQTTITKE